MIPQGLDNVGEDFDINTGKEKLSDGYGQSKYVAEQLVTRSQQRGLPAIIYRLGNQAAAVKTSYWNDRDFTYLLLKAVIHLQKTPDIDWTVELTPVDFASRFIIHLATKDFCSNAGKIFHLTNSKGPKWSALMDWLRSFGYELETVDPDVWVEEYVVTYNTVPLIVLHLYPFRTPFPTFHLCFDHYQFSFATRQFYIPERRSVLKPFQERRRSRSSHSSMHISTGHDPRINANREDGQTDGTNRF